MKSNLLKRISTAVFLFVILVSAVPVATLAGTGNAYALSVGAREIEIGLAVGETKTVVQPDVNAADSIVSANLDEYIVTVKAENINIESKTITNETKVTSITSGNEYYVSDGNGHWLSLQPNSTFGYQIDVAFTPQSAYKWTFTYLKTYKGEELYLISCKVDNTTYYLCEAASNSKIFEVVSDESIAGTFGWNPDEGIYALCLGCYHHYLNYGRIFGNYGWTYNEKYSDPTRTHPFTVTETKEDAEYKTNVTFTGTGDGITYVKVGDVMYKVAVTAPETEETVELNSGESFIPNGTCTKIESGNVVSIKNGKVVADKGEGEALVISSVKNAGGKVTEYYVYYVKVTVEEEPEFTLGDLNDDGQINMKDIIILRKIVAGILSPTDVQLRSGDLNGDGNLNMKDIMLLRKKVAGVI